MQRMAPSLHRLSATMDCRAPAFARSVVGRLQAGEQSSLIRRIAPGCIGNRDETRRWLCATSTLAPTHTCSKSRTIVGLSSGAMTGGSFVPLHTSTSPAIQPWPLRALDVKNEQSGANGPMTPAWDDVIWASPAWSTNRIFCNRSLNMASISAIGFDMDYTMAQYEPQTFEMLAYQLTTKALVKDFGYPEEITTWTFDWRFMVRGLVIDKKLGNICKMDRHKYVKNAYHGFEELTRDERLRTYNRVTTRDSFDGPAYALVDTLFSLAEAYLFAQLVEHLDKYPERLPAGTRYEDLYRDVREAVDLCHRDGSLKQAVAAEPDKYIKKDPTLRPLLEMIRKSGRKTFIVTNSLWDYTHVVMSYLLNQDASSNSQDWLQLFDVVITGSAKPAFFSEMRGQQIFKVDTPTGMMTNTDQGHVLPQVGSVGVTARSMFTDGSDGENRGRAPVFQGGNFTHLHNMLGIKSGSQVLYVGDHIYGDIVRSKKTLGWRTMLIIPELDDELDKVKRYNGAERQQELRNLRHRWASLDDQIHRLEWAAK
eukprot:jgi/Mesvir1/1355/Mv12279-RA.1